MECLGTNSSMATPRASSTEVATGSIRKFWGSIGRNLQAVRSCIFTPTAVRSPPMTGSVAGAISFSLERVISPMPVPKIAELSMHSPIALRTLFFEKSSLSFSRSIATSIGFWSAMSSFMSKKRPLPKVASSISATVDSTACCKAGATILDRSEALVLSSEAQIPLNKR